MKKKLFAGAIALAYLAAYCDWLQPGFLKFGIPAAWNQPLRTATTYDLSEGIHHTAQCATLAVIPDWAKPNNWRRAPTAPKPCPARLRLHSER